MDEVYFRELLYVCKTGCNVIAQISVVKVSKGLTSDLLKKKYIYHDIYIKEPCQSTKVDKESGNKNVARGIYTR